MATIGIEGLKMLAANEKCFGPTEDSGLTSNVAAETVSAWIDHAINQPENLDVLAITWMEYNLGLNPEQIQNFLADPSSHISRGHTMEKILQIHFTEPALKATNADRARSYWAQVITLFPEMLTLEQHEFLQQVDSEKIGVVGLGMLNIFKRMQPESEVVTMLLDVYHSGVAPKISSVA